MPSTTRGASRERLGAHLLGPLAVTPLGVEIEGWLAEPRFRQFAEQYRDKIRKKLRNAADEPARLDVRAELRVASMLLRDRRFELDFEAYGSQRGGPDFTVSYRTVHRFNLEVTRVRRRPDTLGLASSILAKLRQLPPSLPNALLLSIGEADASSIDVIGAVKLLRANAEARDEAFFGERGFDGTRAFHERYLRLGGVYVLAEAAGPGAAELWLNRSARMPLNPKASRDALLTLRTEAAVRRG